jgi:hypothetical protein
MTCVRKILSCNTESDYSSEARGVLYPWPFLVSPNRYSVLSVLYYTYIGYLAGYLVIPVKMWALPQSLFNPRAPVTEGGSSAYLSWRMGVHTSPALWFLPAGPALQ